MHAHSKCTTYQWLTYSAIQAIRFRFGKLMKKSTEMTNKCHDMMLQTTQSTHTPDSHTQSTRLNTPPKKNKKQKTHTPNMPKHAKT